MKFHIKRYILVPTLLALYLAGMSVMAYPNYRNGEYSATFYFGVIAATALVIVLLFFFIRKRDRMRSEHEEYSRRN